MPDMETMTPDGTTAFPLIMPSNVQTPIRARQVGDHGMASLRVEPKRLADFS
jgi:hypothetical protein